MIEVWDGNNFVPGTPVQGQKYKETSENGSVLISYWNEIETPIRIISTGSMQRRFTIPEEVFISSDASATVIKSRLLNASYCNLDYQDTIDGVDYICQVLLDGGVIADKEVRKAELLSDGTKDEAL